MSTGQKLKEEFRSLMEAMLYFAVWVFGLMLVKTLILREYQITFTGWSIAFVGVLVLAKVVLFSNMFRWVHGSINNRPGSKFSCAPRCMWPECSSS